MKAKWFVFLAVVLLLAPIVGCASDTVLVPSYTAEQVIYNVQVLGIPAYFPNQPTNPMGQWAAAYEGDNKWRIRGSIVTRYRGKDYYRTTTWLHTETAISLVNVVGEGLPTQFTPTSIKRVRLIRGK